MALRIEFCAVRPDDLAGPRNLGFGGAIPPSQAGNVQSTENRGSRVLPRIGNLVNLVLH